MTMMQPGSASPRDFFRDATGFVTNERVAFGNASALVSEVTGVRVARRAPQASLLVILSLCASAMVVAAGVLPLAIPGPSPVVIPVLIVSSGLALAAVGAAVYVRRKKSHPVLYYVQLITVRGPLDLPASPDRQWAYVVEGAIRHAIGLAPLPPVPESNTARWVVIGGVVCSSVVLAVIIAGRREPASDPTSQMSSSSGDSCIDPLVSWRAACDGTPLQLHNLLGKYDYLGADGPKMWCADLRAGKNESSLSSCEPFLACIRGISSCEFAPSCRTALLACNPP